MKNKFALCFRPVEVETEEADHKRHVTGTNHERDRDVAICKSIVVSKEHKNRKMAAGILGSGSPKFSCHPRQKTGSRKALSRVLKSILFETSPGIRVGDGKIRQITFLQSNESSNTVDDKQSKMKKRDSINVEQASSSSFSSTTSNTSSSTASVSPSSESNDGPNSLKKMAFERSRSNSFDQKKKPKTNVRTRSTKEDLVLYLIILALFATIIWGKILAVLFTSLCLYIIPTGLNGFYWRSENAVKLPEMETSKEHKKRVIMEGLLERKPVQRALNL